MLKQKVANTLGLPVRSHLLRVVALQGSGVAVLQGSDGQTITHQVAELVLEWDVHSWHFSRSKIGRFRGSIVGSLSSV